MTAESTYVARQTGTFVCAKLNQQQGVDQCLDSPAYCILDGVVPT
jgi:hypothetical protein